MGTWNSNMEHERDGCVTGSKSRFHPWGITFSLSRDFTGFISSGYSFDWTLLKHFTSCVLTMNSVLFSFPQDLTVGPFAWWEMIGLSPHHYFLIRFSRAMSSGKQLMHLFLFRWLRIIMESVVTNTNQVCLHAQIETTFCHYFSIVLPFKESHWASDNGFHFSHFINSTIFGSLERWT